MTLSTRYRAVTDWLGTWAIVREFTTEVNFCLRFSKCYTDEMITPSHIIYSWALARKSEGLGGSHKRTLAFVLGALFPDTPTWAFFIICGLILGYSGQTMWDDMYFNSIWSIPITLTHSFILWPLLIIGATYTGWNFFALV